MRITLNKQEHALLRDYGDKFRKETGNIYSTYYMMTLLAQQYSDNLDTDLKKVLDVKLQEVRETKAKEARSTEE